MFGPAERVSSRTTGPVRLSDLSEPQPDLALVRARPDDYTESHPTPPDVLRVMALPDLVVPVDDVLR